jgi:hypothetical protein
MLNERRKALNIHCCIGIKGHLDPSWQEWFEDLQIVPQASGKTLLCGSLLDQAALYRVLLKINSLSLTLLSLEIDCDWETRSRVQSANWATSQDQPETSNT